MLPQYSRHCHCRTPAHQAAEAAVPSPQTNIELALTIDADPADARRCRQTLEGQVSVAVYGLGRMAEEAICESLRLQYFFLPQVVERCAPSA